MCTSRLGKPGLDATSRLTLWSREMHHFLFIFFIFSLSPELRGKKGPLPPRKEPSTASPTPGGPALGTVTARPWLCWAQTLEASSRAQGPGSSLVQRGAFGTVMGLPHRGVSEAETPS